MLAFFEYLRNITYYLMFATVAGMIAPAGKYRKFVSLILGFVMLLLMLRPLAGFVGGEMDISEWFTGVIPSQPTWETYSTDWENTHLREVFESQLESQLMTFLGNEGFTVYSATFEYTDDFTQITQVRTTLSRIEAPQRVPFIRIEPVRIGEPELEECPISTAAKNLISQFYNLPTTHIHVNVRMQ
ncbi:MAG: stage III sporulation protein AF [Defluviitaleaceae bacterium]|nr:stage III sporulation protein AF [Defluviitaleaceae bacterium]